MEEDELEVARVKHKPKLIHLCIRGTFLAWISDK
jgi:hypothetical protein